MTRRMSNGEITNRAKAKRSSALARNEFRVPSEPRAPALGVTSLAVKILDPSVRAMIEDFERARSVGCEQEGGKHG